MVEKGNVREDIKAKSWKKIDIPVRYLMYCPDTDQKKIREVNSKNMMINE
jgi:hypothetical protein